ncbi:uncharacterized protein [Setaria viridis]|uniref:uncharacterized protein n=1 Tax=Setaria viridis TaxID=4556 RepID=UPI003B3A5898
MWKAQVLAAARGSHLVRHLIGAMFAPAKEIEGKINDKPVQVSNPAYEEWYATDQQTRARAVNTRLALATAQRGNQTIVEYVGKLRTLSDEMASAGRPLEDEELVEYIITGLNHDFDPIVFILVERVEPVPVSDLRRAWN